MYTVSQLIIHLLCKWMSVSFRKQKTKQRVKNQGSKPNSEKKNKKNQLSFH